MINLKPMEATHNIFKYVYIIFVANKTMCLLKLFHITSYWPQK
jgi:hypothetical protein